MMRRFPSRKNTPIRISTSGPANERGGLDLMGGAGGGAWTVLAIFHLAVYLARRLLSRHGGRLRRCGRRSTQVSPFHQLDDADDEQNQRPSAVPTRTVEVVE